MCLLEPHSLIQHAFGRMERQSCVDGGQGGLAATFIVSLKWRYKNLAKRVVDNSTRYVDQGLSWEAEGLERLRELVCGVCVPGKHG